MKQKRSESGQTLVLVIFAIVGLFGFAALAVDFGMLYSERRRAQNAVDAASLAMASAASRPEAETDSSLPFTAAMNMMAKNGYGDDTDPNRNDEKPIDVQVYHPPVSGEYIGNDIYYQVIIRENVDKIFAQFVFSGQEQFTVEAVAKYQNITDLSHGKAVYATGQNSCLPGIIINGGSNTDITGGGIFSNSGGTPAAGGSCDSAEATGASGSIIVRGGDISMAGSWNQNAHFSASPAPVANQPHENVTLQPPPNCNGLTPRTFDDRVSTLEPGYYAGDIRINNGAYTMNPGLYCLNGSLTINGGTVKATDPKGITIYMMPTGGGISFSGSADLDLRTGNSILDADGNNFTGYLIFMDVNNLNGIDMSGNNGSFFQGSIYAPGPRDPITQEKCNIGGDNKSISMHSSIVCSTVGIAGNSKVTIIYDPKENRRVSKMLEQTK